MCALCILHLSYKAMFRVRAMLYTNVHNLSLPIGFFFFLALTVFGAPKVELVKNFASRGLCTRLNHKIDEFPLRECVPYVEVDVIPLMD